MALQALLKNNRVDREKDEYKIYRYALKVPVPTQPIGAEKDLGIKPDQEGEDVTQDAKDFAISCDAISKIAADTWQYVKVHPNSSIYEIACAIHSNIYKVEGFLLFDSNRGSRQCYHCEEDEYGVRRYTCILPPQKETPKERTLDDFTPREMFEHLKKLGYKWKPQTLWHEKVTVERNFVEFDKI